MEDSIGGSLNMVRKGLTKMIEYRNLMPQDGGHQKLNYPMD